MLDVHDPLNSLAPGAIPFDSSTTSARTGAVKTAAGNDTRNSSRDKIIRHRWNEPSGKRLDGEDVADVWTVGGRFMEHGGLLDSKRDRLPRNGMGSSVKDSGRIGNHPRADNPFRPTIPMSSIISVLVVILLLVILSLLLLAPIFKEVPAIVTYQSSRNETETVGQRKVSTAIGRKPSAPSSARAKVIAANTETPLAVPVPDTVITTPSTDFGNGDEAPCQRNRRPVHGDREWREGPGRSPRPIRAVVAGRR